MALLNDFLFWWTSIGLLDKALFLFTLGASAYLISRKTPMATLLATILCILSLAYFTEFFGIHPSETRGKLHLEWKKW